MFKCWKNKPNRNVNIFILFFIFYFSFLSGKSSTKNVSTMGVPNYFSTYKLSDGSLVHTQIMDTAGEEKFRALTTGYYKKADCCLLVYDITNKNSFEECKEYFNDKIKENCKKNIQVILLGNKSDLEESREVPSEEGAKFCLENNYIFMETSCLKNTNVSDAFETLIELTHIEAMKNKPKIATNLRVSKKKQIKKKNNFFC